MSDWGDDYGTLSVAPDVALPKWLTDLRDGDAPSPSQQGLARQQRLAQMERDLSACADVVADCERYAAFMENLENPCVHDLVPKLMGRHLDDLRTRAVRKGRQLRSELAILRRQG